MTLCRKLTATLTVFVLLLASAAIAGPYTDDLAKCLVSKTTKDDRNLLVQWMIASTSAHPAVASMVTVSDAQIDQYNQKAAGLFVDLLTVSCRDKAQQAIKYEGKSSVESSFQVLGQVAGRELFTDPGVARAMSGLGRYVDEQRLAELSEPEK